jgi:hypothetical protein
MVQVTHPITGRLKNKEGVANSRRDSVSYGFELLGHVPHAIVVAAGYDH